jgi:hypothetical protein
VSNSWDDYSIPNWMDSHKIHHLSGNDSSHQHGCRCILQPSKDPFLSHSKDPKGGYFAEIWPVVSTCLCWKCWTDRVRYTRIRVNTTSLTPSTTSLFHWLILLQVGHNPTSWPFLQFRWPETGRAYPLLFWYPNPVLNRKKPRVMGQWEALKFEESDVRN